MEEEFESWLIELNLNREATSDNMFKVYEGMFRAGYYAGMKKGYADAEKDYDVIGAWH